MIGSSFSFDPAASSFSFAARHCCHNAWNCIASSFFGSCVGNVMRQRGIDVVAAEQDVIAHRDPLQRDLAVLFLHRDQREIGGAAADVDHQDQIAHADPLAPIRIPLDPGIEGGLRLFQQDDVAIARLPPPP